MPVQSAWFKAKENTTPNTYTQIQDSPFVSLSSKTKDIALNLRSNERVLVKAEPENAHCPFAALDHTGQWHTKAGFSSAQQYFHLIPKLCQEYRRPKTTGTQKKTEIPWAFFTRKFRAFSVCRHT